MQQIDGFLNLFFITLFRGKCWVNPIKQCRLCEEASKPQRHSYSHLNGPQTKITLSGEAVCIPLRSLGVRHSALISCQERQPDTVNTHVSCRAVTTTNVVGWKMYKWISRGFGKDGRIRYVFHTLIECFIMQMIWIRGSEGILPPPLDEEKNLQMVTMERHVHSAYPTWLSPPWKEEQSIASIPPVTTPRKLLYYSFWTLSSGRTDPKGVKKVKQEFFFRLDT